MNTGTTATESGAVPPPDDGTAFHPDCFACGICNVHGLRLHFDVGTDGVARAAWNPSAEFKSYADRVHGGVIATLMDSAMVHALLARNVEGVTAELLIRYHCSVAFDKAVEITGWVESSRRGVFFCKAEVRQDNRLAAYATAKFMRMAQPGAGE